MSRAEELDRFRGFADGTRWRFAKTYVESYPHEYTLRQCTSCPYVDHPPPHCHAYVGGRDARVDLRTLGVLNPPLYELPAKLRRALLIQRCRAKGMELSEIEARAEEVVGQWATGKNAA